MKILPLTLGVVIVGLTACAPHIPLPTIHEPSTQPKVLAAQHWDSLAMNIAQRLNTALADIGTSDPTVLYIKRPAANTKFHGVFHELLKTQLLEQGFGVSRDAASADFIVEYAATHAGDADLDVMANQTEVEAADDDLVITIAVLSGSRYVTRITEFFYVDTTTSGEYIASKPPVPGRLIEVVGQ